MKFSDQLVDDAKHYLEKKTGEKPDKGVTEEFLRSIAKLGELFAKNADAITKES